MNQPHLDPNPHFSCLNGFRTIAVFMVLLFHVFYFFDLKLPSFVLRVAQNGFLGVDLFFVLSGFLISGLLFNEYNRFGSIQPLRFYYRRAFKIVPQYLAVLLCASLLTPSMTHLTSYPFYFLFLQNYVYPIESIGHLWSIAVEEHFYIFLPLLFMMLYQTAGKKTTDAQIITFFALIILCNVLRFVLWQNVVLNFPQKTHFRFDALIFGCLLRTLYDKPSFKAIISSFQGQMVLFFLSFCSFIYFYVFSFEISCWWHYTLVYVASGCAILSAIGGFKPLRVITEFPLLDYIGRSSYGIYLWHYIVLFPIVALYEKSHDSKLIPLYALLTLALGIISTITIERYFLRLRDRLLPVI